MKKQTEENCDGGQTWCDVLDYADLWDKWNTDKEDGKGHCTFGSGQNQMTMTYISFTGWLRYAEHVLLINSFSKNMGRKNLLLTSLR